MSAPFDASQFHDPADGYYAVHPEQPLPLAGGGLDAFAATDRRSPGVPLMAVRIARTAPARPRPLQALTARVENLLVPLALLNAGAGEDSAGYVICPAPAGKPLSTVARPLAEPLLIDQVLRPVAQVLETLAARGLTHRGIRPSNVFVARGGRPVTLGCAWAAPPAMHQPALFEPPYSAMCRPSARGDGCIADDVYALGCLLLTLALGRQPLADLDDEAILRRKLELGSYAALAGDERLPPMIADLARGMLAEDPEHRPPPGLLLDPAVARARRVAARPPRRAPRPLTVGDTAVWDARSLAHAIGTRPADGLAVLRGGSATQWLRRGLGDVALAAPIEELVRQRALDAPSNDQRADAILSMRAVVLLDPLAPLCWRGVAVWPDGIGAALIAPAGEGDETPGLLAGMVQAEAAAVWASLRDERCDSMTLRLDAQQHRAWLQARGPAGGLWRLVYMLNPLQPCGSPALAGATVRRIAALLPAMEAAVAHRGTLADKAGPAQSGTGLVDAEMAAFIAARAERRTEADVSALSDATGPPGRAVAELRLLSRLQARYFPKALPAIAAEAAGAVVPALTLWRHRPTRDAVSERLRRLAEDGFLAPMAAAVDDAAARAADAEGARLAAAELQQIEQELARAAQGGDARSALASRIGHEIAAGAGLVALTGVLLAAALG